MAESPMSSVLTQPDTDELSILLPHIKLDRKHPRPLYEQLQTAIEFAIFSGHLPDRAPLPSVRLLANALSLAPNTVVRAYQALEHDGFIRSSPKRGYFVVLGADWIDEAETSGEPATREVLLLIDAAVQAARNAHLASSTFLRMVIERTKHAEVLPRVVAVVGYQEAFLHERMEYVARELADLPNVRVTSFSFQDLRDPMLRDQLDLRTIDCFIVPVGEVREAANLLAELKDRIVPMTRILRPELRAQISQLPDDTKFGVITGRQEHVGRVIANLRELHPLLVPPVFASTDRPEEIQQAVESADVLVIGTRARPFFAHYGPLHKPSIEIVSFPDDKTMRRVRAFLKHEFGDE